MRTRSDDDNGDPPALERVECAVVITFDGNVKRGTGTSFYSDFVHQAILNVKIWKLIGGSVSAVPGSNALLALTTGVCRCGSQIGLSVSGPSAVPVVDAS